MPPWFIVGIGAAGVALLALLGKKKTGAEEEMAGGGADAGGNGKGDEGTLQPRAPEEFLKALGLSGHDSGGGVGSTDATGGGETGGSDGELTAPDSTITPTSDPVWNPYTPPAPTLDPVWNPYTPPAPTLGPIWNPYTPPPTAPSPNPKPPLDPEATF